MKLIDRIISVDKVFRPEKYSKNDSFEEKYELFESFTLFENLIKIWVNKYTLRELKQKGLTEEEANTAIYGLKKLKITDERYYGYKENMIEKFQTLGGDSRILISYFRDKVKKFDVSQFEIDLYFLLVAFFGNDVRMFIDKCQERDIIYRLLDFDKDLLIDKFSNAEIFYPEKVIVPIKSVKKGSMKELTQKEWNHIRKLLYDGINYNDYVYEHDEDGANEYKIESRKLIKGLKELLDKNELIRK